MATFVFDLSLIFLTIVLIALSILIFRRWREERTRDRRGEQRRSAGRIYLARLDGRQDQEDELQNIPVQTKLDAVSHLMRLMRGEAREELLDLADRDRLFEPAIAATLSARAARRSEAILTLEQFGSHRCIQALEVLLANDSSMTVRLEAAAALSRLGALPSLRDTISLLKIERGSPTRLHLALFTSQAQIEPDQIRRLLAEDIAPPLRAALVEALSANGDLADMAIFENAARHADEEVRAAALRSAQRIGDPRSESWVCRALSDPADLVRAQAAKTCAELGCVKARPQMKELLHDKSIWVRIRASEGLAMLDGKVA